MKKKLYIPPPVPRHFYDSRPTLVLPESKMWNRALSEKEIRMLYEKGKEKHKNENFS